MSLTPKHLYGPSAVGAAQARALELRGGDFQWSQRDAGTIVKKQGEFRKIITTGAEYLAYGRLSNTANGISFQSFGLPYQIPFRPGSWAPSINLGAGQYMGSAVESVPTQFINTTYTIHPPVGSSTGQQSMLSYVTGFEGFMWVGTVYGVSRFIGGQQWRRTERPFTTWFRANSPYRTYMGERGTPPVRTVLSPFLADLGRVDGAGRMLPDVVISTWPVRGEPSAGAVTAGAFTRPEAEFLPLFGLPFSTRQRSGFFLAEAFFSPGVVSVSPSTLAKVWLFVLEAHSTSAIGVYDVTPFLYADAEYPEPGMISGETFEFFTVTAGDVFSAFRSISMAMMRNAVLPDGTLVISYPAPTTFSDGSTGTRWADRIARITFSPGVAATVTRDIVQADSTQYSRFYIDDLIHLGANRLLATRAGNSASWGPGRPDAPITFLLSEDGGLTWSEFTPTGIDTPLEYRNIGVFTTHKPYVDSENPGVVLLPVRRLSDETFYVYSSEDGGLSWTRRGKIAGPHGPNPSDYRELVPGMNILRPVDVTIPDRYAPLE